jgi:hypothetical protein
MVTVCTEDAEVPGIPRLAAYVVGALPIDRFNGAPGPVSIVAPGFYFRIEELASGARPGPGKAWIRHENCMCYEIEESALASASEFIEITPARRFTKTAARADRDYAGRDRNDKAMHASAA